jgi:outer membrane protein assembly factor BamE (lipoprotein component of BamABCDE complex)
MPARLAGAALLLATSACSWNKTVINEADFLTRADQVIVGQTKREQLPEILGSTPLTWIQTDNGSDVYVYTYGQSKTNGFNIILLGISKTNTRIDSAYFVTDKDGVVSKKFVGTNSQDVPFEWWAFGD